jgi:hypothetical protein
VVAVVVENVVVVVVVVVVVSVAVAVENVSRTRQGDSR